LPPLLIFGAYFVRKWYLARKLQVHGIGKGAPGFQTSVRRVRITPEIAARIQRGEEVSPEEIAAASAQAEKEAASGQAPLSPSLFRDIIEVDHRSPAAEKPPLRDNEWLPDNIVKPKKRAKAKRK
ncbi:hypothetical protein FISHEDRAFT_44844, partial [Fistulina hepatica ATCC 64428]